MPGSLFDNVKGILLDMDGVIHVGDSPVPGAAGAINYLDSKGIPYRFLTNTTTLSNESLWLKMTNMGLPLTSDAILTVHQAAAAYLRSRPQGKCYLLVDDNVLQAYKGLPLSESDPDYIVIGDIGDRWNYTLLNDIFNLVMEGAEMVALHTGRFWRTESGLKMDIGAFVCGLEYSTGRDAIIIGKPAPKFFQAALKDLGLSSNEVVMIGDDIHVDVGGAQKAGIPGVLVKTGKYREDDVERSGVEPDAVLSSIAELKELL